MVKIKMIKEVEILSSTFKIVWDKTNDAGSFNWSNSEIKIGIKSVSKDPSYTLQVISHEVMEIILVGMGGRFVNGRTEENYLFNFDHQTFENAMQIHTQTISKFIQWKN